MFCEGCGVEALVMKTVRRRTEERRFTLCDPCWMPLGDRLWIVDGRQIAAARCDRCGHWQHPSEMADLRRGAKWDGYGGCCSSCSR